METESWVDKLIELKNEAQKEPLDKTNGKENENI